MNNPANNGNNLHEIVQEVMETMIKGVNKTIIEVNDPGSIYFEKAVFYLKPGVRQLPRELAQREADRCFARAEGFRRQRRSYRLGRLFIYLGLIAVTAALLITLV